MFDLGKDPSEKKNLAEDQPAKVKELLSALDTYAREAVPPKGGSPRDRKPADFKAPKVWGE